MYRALIRRHIRSLFANVNRQSYDPLLNSLAPDFEHFVLGTHALSGIRDNRDDTREWYARLFRVMPELEIVLNRIEVEGPPWRMLTVLDFSAYFLAEDGTRMRGRGFVVGTLAWGKITSMKILPDTEELVAILDRMAEAGLQDAHALPIDNR